MNYRVIVLFVTIAIVLMSSALFVIFSTGAKQAQLAVISDAQQADLSSDTVNKGLFVFEQPSYMTQNHSCEAPFKDDVYTSLVMSYQTTPRSCSIFVNGELIRTQSDLRPDCRGQCPYEDFSLTTYIGNLDVRDTHNIEICCNDICIQKELDPQCS